MNETRKAGRPKLPEGQARSVKITTRIKPAAAEKFRAKIKAQGITEAEAIRQALAMWTNG